MRTSTSPSLLFRLPTLTFRSGHGRVASTHRAPGDDLAGRVERDGIGTLPDDELSSLADAGRHAGCSATIVDLLTDQCQPRAARERALGRVMIRLDQTRGASYAVGR